MAEIARQHHDELQDRDLKEPGVRAEATRIALETIETKLPNVHKAVLAEFVKEGDISSVIKQLANGKATGIDGLPYEFWKALAQMAQMKPKPGEPEPPNVINMLKLVFQDIERNGVNEGSDFAEGWLCPLYKKNDRREIGNYRPITLLNSDYKIFTKVLAIRMANACPSVIHKDQAGFIPGRSIIDQIRLTQMIISYAEVEEEGGMILLLDQEKAYDKIDHTYLWTTLRAYNFPEHFVRTVKSLYEHAETAVMINGEISEKYKVKRGVRQGDPLSCLLFDLAIEPLASMLRKSELKGYKAPGAAQRTIVSLFADDTTVYLNGDDDYATLMAILNKWCDASGAKFNTNKTEIIPLGSKEYRDQLRLTRQLNDEMEPIPVELDIARDDEAKRSLGAWVGNAVNEINVWATIIEKIDARLARWEPTHPSIEGRKIILQWVIGGVTQYMMAAQGMPDSVEKQLRQRCRSFLWDNAGKNPLSQHHMSAPIDVGGKNALDISVRNEAIKLRMVQDYAKTEEEGRGTWANFAETLLQRNAESRVVVDAKSGINTLAQSWKPKKKDLQRQLKEMLKTASKYGVQIEAMALSKVTMRSMPVWFHIGANDDLNKLNNQQQAKCLRNKHNIMTIGQMELAAKQSPRNHRQRANCECNDCTSDRKNFNCNKPHKCQKIAREIMRCILPKWNPSVRQPKRAPELSDEEKEANKMAEKMEETVIFDPNIQQEGLYNNALRVFVDVNTSKEKSANQLVPPIRLRNSETAFTVSSTFEVDPDGCYVSGAGVWFGVGDDRNRTLRIEEELATKGSGEIGALLEGLRAVPTLTILHINMRSGLLLESLTTKLQENEDQGWLGHPDKQMVKAAVALLRKRGAKTSMRVSSTDENPFGMKEAKKLAENGMKKQVMDTISIPTHSDFHLQGAKLASSTQASLYKGILERRKVKPRFHTRLKLAMTGYAVAEINKATPSEREIWRSVRDRDTPKAIRGFLWKNLHRAYKIGDHWHSIPGYEGRARCGLCGEDETMEHILFECVDSQAIQTVWARAKELWDLKYDNWPEIRIGHVLGSGLIKFIDQGGTVDEGKTRLFKILLQESVHAIWKVRCDRAIERENDPERYHTETEIHNKWLWAINRRLHFDVLQTDKTRYGSKSIPKKVVLNTWSGVLHDERNLPGPDWTRQSGVLVGIQCLPPPGG